MNNDSIGLIILLMFLVLVFFIVDSFIDKEFTKYQSERVACYNICEHHPYEVSGDKCICDFGKEIR